MSIVSSVFAWARRIRVVRLAALGFGCVLLLIVVANVVLWRAAQGRVVRNATDLAGPYDAVIIPGAGVFSNDRPSRTLEGRIDAAVDLYELGIAGHLLASGDNGEQTYDEPTIIRRIAHQQGVPLADITLDYAGFSTWQTCIRAKEVFGVERAVFVTQDRYSNRAAALCRAAGLDVDVYSIENPRVPRYLRIRQGVREPIAAVKALYEMIVRPDPQFLGDYVGLVGSESPANPDPALGEQ